jgi:hypothetical protein
MGGSAADDNSFWEVFTRPLGSSQWALVTPLGVADNGGLVAAVPPAAQGLEVAVRPSQDLTFSPLALTGNGGRTWATGLVDASVAAVPDALALGGGRMLVLLTAGDGAGIMALLQSGTGDGDRGPASLLAAWTADGTHWTVSPPLPLNGAQVLSSGAGPGATAAWVLLSGGRAATIAGPAAPSASGAAWRPLPAPPHGTAVLAPGPGGALDALAVSGGSALTVFRLTPAGVWQQTQAISVPVQLGSSS